MSDSGSLVTFLADPSTLLALGAVAVGTAWYFNRSATPVETPVPIDNQSLEVPDSGHVRISHFAKKELLGYLHEDVRTLYQSFQKGKELSRSGPCLGWRPGQTAPYEWISYGEVEKRAVAFGAGLSAIGLEPGQNSMIGIYAQNCVEWVVAELSCNCYSRVVVPLYDTLKLEAVSYVINLATISLVVCQANKLSLLLELAKSAPNLKTVIIIGSRISQEEQQLATETGITLYSFDDVMKLGRQSPVDLVKPSPDDLSVVCFTSGTTGNPKGVCLTHGNIIASVVGLILHLGETNALTSNDIHISYLPLGHMIERVCQAVLFMHGARIGFFQGDVKMLMADIQELKPTVFVSVPFLFNKIYDKVIMGVSSSPVKKWLFMRAMAAKLSELKVGIVRQNSIWDYLVFRRVQQSLGGRVRLVVTGSTPISEKVLMFLRCSLGCLVFEGYGQTEGAIGATMSVSGDNTYGHVGAPLACNKIKLVDVDDMQYFSNGEGEVCYKGFNVFKGYFKDPEKTAEALDADGWLHSGDIGRWLPNGTLKLIDRKKHIFKLSQGEYVAPERVEVIYRIAALVAQVYLYGDSLKSMCVALVVPDEEVLLDYAQKQNIPGSFKELCSNETIRDDILKSMTDIGKEAGLHSFEQAKALALHDELFSVENGFLTPSLKAKRPAIKAAFMETFVRLYQTIC